MKLFREKHVKEAIAINVSLIFNAYFTMIFPLVVAVILKRELIENYLLYAVIIVVSPTLLFYLFSRLKLVSDLDISNREQRPLYMIFASILFLFIYQWAYSTGVDLVIKVSLALTITSFFFTFISTFWKISGHMTYLLFATVSINYIFGYNYFWPLFALVPLVAWSRVELKHHTWLQTILGTITATVIAVGIYALI